MNRRLIRHKQGRAGDDKGLLQRKLPGQHGMRDGVGKDNPGGSRWELVLPPWAVLLKVPVSFQMMVEFVHEAVVGGPFSEGDADGVCHTGQPAAQEMPGGPSLASEIGKPRRCGHALRLHFKGLARKPHSGLSGVDVREDSQDAVAISWPSGKRIDVE